MRVRMIGKGDGEQLWQLVMAYLKETYGAGGDFPNWSRSTAPARRVVPTSRRSSLRGQHDP